MGTWSVEQINNTSASDIVRLLHSYRFDLSSEKHLQAGIESALTEVGLPFEREKRLSASDIPDFLIKEHIVVECKMRKKSRKIDIFKQLSRYAQHPEVHAIVLASNVAMGLPAEIEGKPVYSASLSRGWI